MELTTVFGELVERLRQKRPVIHEITNYVTEAIVHGISLGSGCGPTHHFVDLYRKAGFLE